MGVEQHDDGISRNAETVGQLPLIVFLDDPRATRVDLTGGKGTHLADLISIPGVKVPEAFVITTSLGTRLLGRNPDIGNQIAELDNLSEQWLRARLEQREAEALYQERQIAQKGGLLREAMAEMIIPEDIEQEIVSAYKQLSQQMGGENVAVAVRSSGTAEDGAAASFAGQYATFLHRQGKEEVIDSVRECLASQYTDRVISYRNIARLEAAEKALKGHPGEIERALSSSEGSSRKKSELAVVVQRMVNASAAGVGFSIDPNTGANSTRIDVSYGLGEAVVSGSVTPDSYDVDSRTGKIVGRELGAKTVKTVYTPGGTTTVEVPLEDRRKFVLSDAKVEEIATIIEAIRKHRGKEVDTEFALDEKEDVYFTQERPETVSAQADSMIVKMRRKFVTEEAAETAKQILKGGTTGCPGAAAGIKLVAETVEEAQRLLESERYRGKDVILVTGRTDPDWVPVMKNLKGIITSKGGANCHAAIVSRELGIPCLVGAEDLIEALKKDEIEEITLDAGAQTVYEGKLPLEETGEDIDVRELLANPTETVVGINMAMPGEARRLHALAELGEKFKISLLRIEFILQDIGVHVNALVDFDEGKIDPSSDLYRRIADKIAGYESGRDYYTKKLSEGLASIAATFPNSEIVVRTTDFKTNEYRSLIGGEEYENIEANPMIGFRGLLRSIAPQNRQAFKWELEAIKRAREMGYGNIEIMFPMVRDPMELTGGPEMEERYGKGYKGVYEIMKEVGMGRGQDGLKVLMMVEVPANVERIEDFIDAGLDGTSFGTNDLTQLTMAADRDSEVLAKILQYGETNPAVVRPVRRVIQICKKRGVETGICGNAPSNSPAFVQMLVEEGVDSMGVVPDRFLATYRLVRGAEQKRQAALGVNGQ